MAVSREIAEKEAHEALRRELEGLVAMSFEGCLATAAPGFPDVAYPFCEAIKAGKEGRTEDDQRLMALAQQRANQAISRLKAAEQERQQQEIRAQEETERAERRDAWTRFRRNFAMLLLSYMQQRRNQIDEFQRQADEQSREFQRQANEQSRHQELMNELRRLELILR